MITACQWNSAVKPPSLRPLRKLWVHGLSCLRRRSRVSATRYIQHHRYHSCEPKNARIWKHGQWKVQSGEGREKRERREGTGEWTFESEEEREKVEKGEGRGETRECREWRESGGRVQCGDCGVERGEWGEPDVTTVHFQGYSATRGCCAFGKKKGKRLWLSYGSPKNPWVNIYQPNLKV